MYDFSKHKVTYHRVIGGLDSRIERLVFRDPETITGLIEYIMVGSTLTVKGDFGCAVFQWYPDDGLPLKNVATYGIGYVSEKCLASETGFLFMEWDPDIVKSNALRFREEYVPEEEHESWDSVWEMANHDDMATPDGWSAFLCDRGSSLSYDIDEWYNIGYRPHDRLEIMLAGLKEAFEQVGKAEPRRPVPTGNKVLIEKTWVKG